ncbi:MAG: hypothetical protein IPF41_16135 [Flavobacteriales bacterium]|nr:hypothetical protein [Flavobacteriales bacterium]
MAATIVSNADPHKTYLGMVGKGALAPKLIRKLEATCYSVTSIMLFVTVDMDVRAAGLDSGNIWMLRTADMEELFRDLSRTDILTDDEFPGAFISCPTLKDPTSFNGRYHDIEMVTYLDYTAFEHFAGWRAHTRVPRVEGADRGEDAQHAGACAARCARASCRRDIGTPSPMSITCRARAAACTAPSGP